MAVSKDKPIRQGYLLVPPLVLKKKWQKKYCVLYSFSNHGIERLELYDHEDDASKKSCTKLITLENCVKISLDPQKNQQFAFSIITKTATHLFASTTSEDSVEWVIACQGVAFRDTQSSTTIEEDNELYCPSGDAGVFHVILVSTDASTRCSLASGDYVLVVANEELQLRKSEAQTLLFTWPYRFIRRYSHKRGRFSFEAGRKCASGEGAFDFEHNNAQEIFKCVTCKMESMKQRLGGTRSVTGASVNGGSVYGDKSVQAVLRSGFGLAPGSPEIGLPNCADPMDDDEGLLELKGKIPRSRSPLVSRSSSESPINVAPKTQPRAPPKPERKNPPAKAASPPAQLHYDHVAERTDAWRTMGTDVHDRRPRSPSLPIFYPTSAHSDYDKLDHFGSTPKLDEDPAYSTICRAHDTSGYGTIRRTPPVIPRDVLPKDYVEYSTRV
ncbi:PTB domain (IRS-1 type) [Nesidiocoris tenuis]|uniref:PTB domain (IRS-1 type) n=1 Tax=Nesidiocoris tenuis TaxID=355587 RepID=A0ABN7BB05_9HEMI|nr:PTB domain (IRS-1 type) [Nesidiocoris tenuis]